MGCCSCLTAKIAGCILQFVNSLLMTSGLFLTIFGTIIQLGSTAVFKVMSSALSAFAGSSLGGSSASLKITDLGEVLGSWSTIIIYSGWALVGLGLLLFGVGFLGCVGVCCASKILLIIYVTITVLITLILGGAALGFTYYKRETKEAAKTQMKNMIKDNYCGNTYTNKNAFTKVWDLIQARIECCGVSNYTDFDDTPNWDKTYNYTKNGNNKIIQLKYGPVACCKLKTTGSFEPEDQDCTISPTTSNSNWNTPCFEIVWTMVETYSTYIVYPLGIVAIFTGILALLAILMLRHHAKSDITPL